MFKKFLILGILSFSILFANEITTIAKKNLIIEYDLQKKGALVVSYVLDKKVNKLNIKDRMKFYKEPALDYPYATVPDDYTNTGFDRGHLANDASFDWSKESLNETYSMANIVPQYPNVNRKTWLAIEEIERYNAAQFNELYVKNVVIYGNEFLKKRPLEDVLKERKFKDSKHKANYISKYQRDSDNLDKKRIALPIAFVKKMVNQKYGYEECYKVPNIENPETDISKYKVDCKTLILR